MTWPFGDIPPMSADIILADPPWNFVLRSKNGEAKSPQAQYDCMQPDEIAALPVGRLCRGDAICFMWTTWPMMVTSNPHWGVDLDRDAPDTAIPVAIRVMRAWGFRPVTGGAWFKRTPHDKVTFGTGYRLRSACEPFILGTIGNPKTSKSVRNILETWETENAIVAATRGHSRKPDDQYALCEQLCPQALKGVELFARQSYTGGHIAWTPWGYEIGKFVEEKRCVGQDNPMSAAPK